MRSFFDRFRRKGADGSPEEPAKKLDAADEIAAHAIKSGYSPTLQKRGTQGDATASGTPTPTSAPAPARVVPERREEVVTFQLGDFLRRIPEQLLAKGPHDETQPLTFQVSELSARIARGQTTVALVEIDRKSVV